MIALPIKSVHFILFISSILYNTASYACYIVNDSNRSLTLCRTPVDLGTGVYLKNQLSINHPFSLLFEPLGKSEISYFFASLNPSLRLTPVRAEDKIFFHQTPAVHYQSSIIILILVTGKWWLAQGYTLHDQFRCIHLSVFWICSPYLDSYCLHAIRGGSIGTRIIFSLLTIAEHTTRYNVVPELL